MIYPYLHQLPLGVHKVHRPWWKFWAPVEYLKVSFLCGNTHIMYSAIYKGKEVKSDFINLDTQGRLIHVVRHYDGIFVIYPVSKYTYNKLDIAEKATNYVSSLVPQLEIYK